MKFLLICTVFICFSLIGFKIANFYRKKKDFYVDICAFCNYASNQVSFALKKTNEIVSSCKSSFTGDFYNYLTIYEKFLDGNITQKEFQEDKSFAILSIDEKMKIDNFFLSFGQMNKEEELEKLVAFKEEFSQKKEFCLNNYIKYKSLYVKLFFLLGLVFVVIFL